MSSLPPSGDDKRSSSGRFEQTQWTVILKARKEGEPGAAEAMDSFARTYWQPIYRYIRREGHNCHQAEDLTQGFYVHFLGKQLLNGIGERTGRFRNYLLTCLKHFLFDERDRAKALKRGGGNVIISRDALEEEERELLEPRENLTPDQVFEQRWAQTIFADAMNALQSDYERREQSALFQQLKDLPHGKHGERRHSDVAATLGITVQAVKNAALTFRRRYEDCLRREVLRTVETSGEVDQELKYLVQIFSR